MLQCCVFGERNSTKITANVRFDASFILILIPELLQKLKYLRYKLEQPLEKPYLYIQMLYKPIIFFSANPVCWVCSEKYFPVVHSLPYFCETSLLFRIATQRLDSEMESVGVLRTGKLYKHRHCWTVHTDCVNPGPAQRTCSCTHVASCWLWMGRGWFGFIAQLWDCKVNFEYKDNEQNSFQSATGIRKEEQLFTLPVSWL